MFLKAFSRAPSWQLLPHLTVPVPPQTCWIPSSTDGENCSEASELTQELQYTNQSSSLLRLFQPHPLNPSVGRAECREPAAFASDLPQEHLQRLLPLSPFGNRSQTLPRELLLTNVLGQHWKWKHFLTWFLCHTIHSSIQAPDSLS